MSDGAVVTQADRDAATETCIALLPVLSGLNLDTFREALTKAFAAHRQAAVAAERARIVAAWERVSQELNHIEGGMHADLEDAASAFYDAIEGTDLESPCHG